MNARLNQLASLTNYQSELKHSLIEAIQMSTKDAIAFLLTRLELEILIINDLWQKRDFYRSISEVLSAFGVQM